MPRNDFVPVRERPLINKIGSGLLDGMIRAGTYGALSSERIRKIADMFRNAGQGPILRAQPVYPQQQQGPVNTRWYDAPVEQSGGYGGYQSVSGPTIPDWYSRVGSVAPGQVSAVIAGQPVRRAIPVDKPRAGGGVGVAGPLTGAGGMFGGGDYSGGAIGGYGGNMFGGEGQGANSIGGFYGGRIWQMMLNRLH